MDMFFTLSGVLKFLVGFHTSAFGLWHHPSMATDLKRDLRRATRRLRAAERATADAREALIATAQRALEGGLAPEAITELTGLSKSSIGRQLDTDRSPDARRRAGLASQMGGSSRGRFAAEAAAVDGKDVRALYDRMKAFVAELPALAESMGIAGSLMTRSVRAELAEQVVGGRRVIDVLLSPDPADLERLTSDREDLELALRAAIRRVEENSDAGRRRGGAAAVRRGRSS
jgi:hypothetical protein